MKLKTFVIISALAICLTQPVYAKDSCKTVLCMAGMLQGEGVVSGCSGAVEDYFSIIKTKHGKFSASRTSSARGSFLKSCQGESGWASKINSKYGRLRTFSF